MFQFVKDYIVALRKRVVDAEMKADICEKEIEDLKAFINSEPPPFEPSNHV